jgi:hypothetical protein
MLVLAILVFPAVPVGVEASDCILVIPVAQHGHVQTAS